MPDGCSFLFALLAFGLSIAAWSVALRRSKQTEQLQRQLDLMSESLARLLRERAISPPPSQSAMEAPPWPTDFPRVICHIGIDALRAAALNVGEALDAKGASPSYLAAKTGDADAAARVIEAIADPQAMIALGQRFAGATLVPVHAIEAEGVNQLPQAYADAIAAVTGLAVDDRIVQANIVGHTGANAYHRMVTPPIFDGPVETGHTYVLVDDTIGMGGTLAMLRHFVESRGGHVVGTTTLAELRTPAGGAPTDILAIRAQTIGAIRQKFDRSLVEDIIRHYAAVPTIEHLSEAQGQFILRAPNADSLRSRLAQARQAAIARATDEAVQGVGDTGSPAVAQTLATTIQSASQAHTVTKQSDVAAHVETAPPDLHQLTSPQGQRRADDQRPHDIAPAPQAVSLEEKLTLRVFVWIAAVALALAGGYLVKYSFDNNVLTAPVRISIAILSGIGMIAAGEVMLRHPRNLQRIGQALSAAGVATLFAALLAAVHVEHLITPSIGFVAMAAVAGAAVVLSLRQGQIVAILGLAGGFLTPAIVQTGQRSAPMLFGYLFVLQLALLLVTRTRRWWPLTLLTLAAAYGWALAWLFLAFTPGDETALGLFLLGTSAMFVLAPLGGVEDLNEQVFRTIIRWAGAAVGLFIGGAMLPVGAFTTSEWVYFGILGAGCLAVAMLDPRSVGLSWLASAAGAVVLTIYRENHASDVAVFAVVATVFGVLYAGGAYLGLWVSRRHRGMWASLSALAATSYFSIAWWGIDVPPFERFWGVTAVGLAIVYAVAAMPVLAKRDAIWRPAAAALLLGSLGFVALAVPLELERQWIAVAWALLVPAAIEIGRRLAVPQMRWAAAALTAGVVIRLLLNPAVLHYPIGPWPVLNWLLYGYGVPAVALALGAWRAQRGSEDADQLLVKGLEGVTLALVLTMVTLMVRHGFHRTSLVGQDVTLRELATYSLTWAGIGMTMTSLAMSWPRKLLARGGPIVAAAGLSIVGVLICLPFNPLLRDESVGSAIVFNWLLYIFGLPAAAALLASAIARRFDRAAAGSLFVVGLILLFALVTLEVRQGFHGPVLTVLPLGDRPMLTHAENYTYSAVWILFGVGLLIVAILTRSPALRWASLAVVMLAVAKVFVWDMAHLRDLYRVLSFFGLGVSLLGLAWLYQRFVFGRQDV